MTRMHASFRHRLLAVVCSGVLLAGAATAQEDATPPGGIPAPEAWEYVRLTPQQRLELRARVRALPKELEEAHNNALSAQVRTLPTWIYEALSNELVSLDLCSTGTYSGPMPRPPTMTGWEYAKRVPHQRYHYRLRARALSPEDRAAYESNLASELATLPEWLQTALSEEAKRYDERLGIEACPHPQF